MTSTVVQQKMRGVYHDLVHRAEQLDKDDLEKFIESILALRARRIAPILSERESELIQNINEGLSDLVRRRFYHLQTNRQQGVLTDSENEELFLLIDQLVKLNIQRVHWIGELARLRKAPVNQLMKQLRNKTPRSWLGLEYRNK